MKIHIISAGSVFSAAASTNRMLSLAKGLATSGNEVQIFCLGSVGSESREKKGGKIDGIPYTHMGGELGCYANMRGAKIFHFFSSILGGIRTLKEKESPDALLLLSVRLGHLFPYLWVARRVGIPVFHERNEYPHRNVRSCFDRFFLWVYLRKVIPHFAGLALMTQALEGYFRENCRRCPPVFHLPMTVDPSRFLKETSRPFADRYILHCGSSFGDKDGVLILVEAFAQIAKDFPDIKLVLVGSDVNQNATDFLQQQIQKLGVHERVILTGLVARNEIPAWIQHAELLALARPANLQAAGGFPTKLGEYLVSGRPVIVTRTGEISDYLQEGVNAWLVEPGLVDCFAAKLREVLTLEISVRNAVGHKGRAVALSVFSLVVQGQRFSRFMNEQGNIYRDNQG